jgi:hypothetical protein
MNRPTSSWLRGLLAVALALGAQVAWLGAQTLDGSNSNAAASDLGRYIAMPENASGPLFAPSDSLFGSPVDAVDVTPVPAGEGTGLDTPVVFAAAAGNTVEFAAAEIPETSTWAAVGFLALVAGLCVCRRLKWSVRGSTVGN